MGEVVLRQGQAAIEAVRGTALPATRRIYAKGHMTKNQALILLDEDRGRFQSQFRAQVGLVDAGYTGSGSLSYEDLPWWLKGVLGPKTTTGTLVNTTGYAYDFNVSPATDDLATYCMEWGDETQAFQMRFGAIDSFDITSEVGKYWDFSVTMLGADLANTTFTAALPERVIEDILGQTTRIAIGPAGAVPTAYNTGVLYSWKLSIKNNLMRKYLSDGTGLMSTFGRGKQEVQLECTFEGNAATIAERAQWLTSVPRVVRLTSTGSVIPGSSPSQAKIADIIVCGRWDAFVIGEKGTNTTFTAVLKGFVDPVLNYDIKATVTNGLVTLP